MDIVEETVDFEVGDQFDIIFETDLEISTTITEIMEDGIVINLDARAISLLEERGGSIISESEYQGRKVTLNKPTRGDVKKFKVYVKNDKGNVVKVNFGDPDMKIRKSDPARRRSFRARHRCDDPGPKDKARYWSCKKW